MPLVSEQSVVNVILDALRITGHNPVHVRNTGSIFKGRDGKIGFGRPKASQKGAPDILVASRGIPWAIECKRPQDFVQSSEQKEWARVHELNGGRYIVAHSLDDVRIAGILSQEIR